MNLACLVPNTHILETGPTAQKGPASLWKPRGVANFGFLHSRSRSRDKGLLESGEASPELGGQLGIVGSGPISPDSKVPGGPACRGARCGLQAAGTRQPSSRAGGQVPVFQEQQPPEPRGPLQSLDKTGVPVPVLNPRWPTDLRADASDCLLLPLKKRAPTPFFPDY